MDKDIEYLNKVMNKKSNNDYFYWIYPFTNENIGGYYKDIDFNNKSVLVPTSSSDHALNAYLLGAKSVDSFDINPLTKYYSELKSACIKSLSLDEFISFLYNKRIFLMPKNYMSKDIYSYIRKELNDNSKYFWDYVFRNYSSRRIYNSKLFTNDFLSLKSLRKANLYFDDDEYNKLSKILKHKSVNYHDINIKDLELLNKRFNVIILSNIPAYLDIVYENRLDYLKDMREIINSIKNNNSYVVINYYYSNLMKVHDGLGIYDMKEVDKYFGDSECLYFDGVDSLNYPDYLKQLFGYEDAVLVLKNKTY